MIRFYFLSANETDETNFSVFRPPFSQEWKPPFRGDGGSPVVFPLYLYNIPPLSALKKQ